MYTRTPPWKKFVPSTRRMYFSAAAGCSTSNSITLINPQKVLQSGRVRWQPKMHFNLSDVLCGKKKCSATSLD